MHRYLLFSGWNYEAKGGWSDFRMNTNSLAEIDNCLKDGKQDWFEVVDTTTLEIVAVDRESFISLACSKGC